MILWPPQRHHPKRPTDGPGTLIRHQWKPPGNRNENKNGNKNKDESEKKENQNGVDVVKKLESKKINRKER